MDNHQQQIASEWGAQTAVTSRRAVGGYLAATTAGSAAVADGRRGVAKSSKNLGTVQSITDDDRLGLDPDALLRAPTGRPEALTPLGTRFLTPRGRDAVLERFPNASSVVISSVALLQLAKEWQRATQGSAFKRSAQRSADSMLIEPPCTGQLVGYMEVERRPASATGATSEDTLHICGDVLHVTAAFSAPRLSMMTGGRFAQGSGPAQPPTSVIANQMQQRANYLWERSRLLREAPSENLVVGWFCAADTGRLASFVNAEWTETQFQYQFWLKNAVCIVFDPLRRHSSGTLGIRVVRLSDAFMREYSKLIDYRSGGAGVGTKATVVLQAFGRGGGRVAAGSTFVTEALRDLGLCSQTMIEEVPFTVQASALSEQYLAWSALQRPAGLETQWSVSRIAGSDPDVQRLSLRRDGELIEHTASGLVQDLDEVTREQSRYQHFLRNHIRIQNQQHEWIRKRRAENEQRRQHGQEPLPEEPLPPHLSSYSEPSRLEPMMVFRDLSESLRDLELVIGGRCEKELALESFKTV